MARNVTFVVKGYKFGWYVWIKSNGTKLLIAEGLPTRKAAHMFIKRLHKLPVSS